MNITESEILRFDDVAMIPQDGDSAALAKRFLPKGSRIAYGKSRVITLKCSALEGHRFAIKTVNDGEPLLSWGLPFGHAIGKVFPGDPMLNKKASAALRGRLSGPQTQESDAIRELLKTQPINFVDLDVTPDSPFLIEEHGFTAVGLNKPVVEEEGTFLGYPRSDGRGVGTRNHVAVIALTASSSPSIVPLKSRWKHYETDHDHFDGVRIVAHTEGESGENVQRNITHIHRCLAGFLMHMNVGAAIVVTTGRERHVSRDTLMEFVERCNAEAEMAGRPPVYPMKCFEAPHAQFVRVHGDLGDTAQTLDEAVLNAVTHATNGVQREPCALSNLCIALQCGGSDSFSGLTGNPLTGAVAGRLILKHGGRAILAESPELVGAEPYILSRVADETVARDFIRTTENYKAYGARHGLSVAGNPSGGNLYRGLYNIVLKSLGAARKKPPNINLDCVLSHGEPLRARGDGPRYAFMDSPGNDLESIAGQVASGSNIIIFITGNGAMTNFPFVPTIKVVTTAKRYELLKHEMDVNAGPYGHGGEDRKKAVDDAFDLCLRVASGERSLGEAAGHSQVSLWRNWAIGKEDRQDRDTTDQLRMPPGSGSGGGGGASKPVDNKLQLCSHVEPHQVRPDPPPLSASLLQESAIERVREDCTDSSTGGNSMLRPWASGASFALIPTSLCSSGIAASMKDQFSDRHPTANIVCPSHTEGCGAAGDQVYEHRYQRLMLGHALHPSIGRALFLEHGCEKTHNDYFRNCLKEAGVIDLENSSDLASFFGFWSLQRDGGLANAQRKATEYFFGGTDDNPSPNNTTTHSSVGRLFGIPWSARPVTVGLLVDSAVAASDAGTLLAPALGIIVRFLSQVHVHTVLPVNSPLITLVSAKFSPPADIDNNNPASSCESDRAQPPSATADMEDFFTPKTSSRKVKPPIKKKRKQDKSVSSLFACEALMDATIPFPTLLPGQMVDQTPRNDVGGLHVMDMPKGVTWDETVSCLSPACDVMLLVAGSKEISFLPGSCLCLTIRRSTPSVNEGGWHKWTTDTCEEILRVLRSPLVSGGVSQNPEELSALQKSLFSVTTFVVPRGHAVSF